MMKSVLLILVIFIFGACGSHKQTIERVTPFTKTTESGETNPTLKLINAVNSGNLDEVKTAIDEGADLTTLTEEGLTLLIVGIRAEQYAIVDYLIAQGADPTQTTTSEEFESPINAFEFVQAQPFDQEIKDIFVGILNKEEFDGTVLNEKMFNAILFKNKFLVSWLLEKGADPNYVQDRKHTPLIFLFKQRGIEGQELDKLEEVFDVLVSHPEIDVNKKVRRDTPLSKAEQRLRSNPEYQGMVNRLIEMGASS
jgi:ankyrin repeat protein